MDIDNEWIILPYVLSSTLFILAILAFSKQSTAKAGNMYNYKYFDRYGILGMVICVVFLYVDVITKDYIPLNESDDYKLQPYGYYCLPIFCIVGIIIGCVFLFYNYLDISSYC